MSKYVRGGVMMALGAGAGVGTFFAAKKTIAAFRNRGTLTTKLVWTGVSILGVVLTIGWITGGARIMSEPDPTPEEQAVAAASSKNLALTKATRAANKTARLNRRIERKIARGKLTAAQARGIRALM